MTYSPFGKSTTPELSASDLAALVDVPEGWFIEYKRDPCKPKDYAKEASAFSNARGGWIFVGLAEDSTAHRPLGGPGVPKADAQRLLDAARDAIAQNLSPAPRMELKVVDGPIPELSIPDDRAVLVIRLPKSENTPHIHCSGRIYRRQVDVAEPVQITDRAELDGLYARKTKLLELIDEQLNLGFDESWATEIATPWVHIAFAPDPSHSTPSKRLRFEQFRAIVQSKTPNSIGLPDVYSSALGYVARNQRIQEVPHGAATTLEYAHGGAIYLTFPMSTAPLTDSPSPVFLRSETGTRFTKLLQDRSFENVQVIDGTHVAAVIYGLGQHVHALLQDLGAPPSYCCRIQLRNVFRRVPFFDSPAYVSSCESDAIPVIHRSSLRFPWAAKRWLSIEDIHDTSTLFLPLLHVLSSLGVGDNTVSKVASECIRASVNTYGNEENA